MARHVDGYLSYCVSVVIDDTNGFRSECKECKNYPEAEKAFRAWLKDIRTLSGLKAFNLKIYGGGDLLKFEGGRG